MKLGDEQLAAIARAIRSDVHAFALAHAAEYRLYLRNRKEPCMTRQQKTLTALITSPNKQSQKVDIPAGTTEEILAFIESVLGKDVRYVRGFREELDLIVNDDVERYFDELPCRAIYATSYHVGKNIDLYEWDEDWKTIEKEGELIGVIRGAFLVIARTRLDDYGFVTRSMTDAEIEEVSEAFADTASGRLEVLRKELGKIVV